MSTPTTDQPDKTAPKKQPSSPKREKAFDRQSDALRANLKRRKHAAQKSATAPSDRT